MKRAAADLLLALSFTALLACSGGRPDGRLRELREGEPAARGGEYAVAEHLESFSLPGPPVSLLAAGPALYAFMNDKGIAVFDISRPEKPVFAGIVPAPPPVSQARMSYLHAGVLDGGELLVADRASNRIVVYDASNPLAPALMKTIAVAGGAPTQVLPAGERLVVPLGGEGIGLLPRRSEDGATAIPVLRNWDFVKQAAFYPGPYPARWLLAADNYDGGLRVVDFADPARPAEAASMQTGSFCDCLLPFDGFALLANRSRGLAVVDLADPAKPFIRSLFYERGDDSVSCLARWGATAALAGQRSGFFDIFDLANPDAPAWLARIPAQRPVDCLAVQGDIAFVGAHWLPYSDPERKAETLQVWRLERRKDARGERKIVQRPRPPRDAKLPQGNS